ncbi:MAG: hypothetical protein PHR77_00660 [Kiritimatiellae bacterium]|nr:hypothetical protein [Kiritimatiellia bacterium]MDD5522539.1 hypothetical protein [Kiritimatiellia bacterium]
MRFFIILFLIFLSNTLQNLKPALATEKESIGVTDKKNKPSSLAAWNMAMSEKKQETADDICPSSVYAPGIFPVTESIPPSINVLPARDNAKVDNHNKTVINKGNDSQNTDIFNESIISGITVIDVGGVITPVFSVGGELKFNCEDVFSGYFRGDLYHDLTGNAADRDRWREWFMAHIEGEYYPLRKVINGNDKEIKKILTGLIIKMEIRGNTPSCEEHRYEALTGVSLKYKNKAATARGYLAYFYIANEVDDDLAKTRGFDYTITRADYMCIKGPAVGTDIETKVTDYSQLIFWGRCLIDQQNDNLLGNIGLQAEFDFSKVLGCRNGHNTYLVPFVEQRWLDEDFEEKTGISHDLTWGVMFKIRF